MRTAIFIDGAYFLRQAQDEGVAPDWGKLADHLLAPLRASHPLDLMRCYFYDCAPWTGDKPSEREARRLADHARFTAELEETGRWRVRLGKLERRRDGDRDVYQQKRVDVQLSVDLVRHCAAGHIQHAVLVAGDSDFIPALVAAQESGTTVTLWCDKDKSVHKELLRHADEVQYFDWKKLPAVKAKRARKTADDAEVAAKADAIAPLPLRVVAPETARAETPAAPAAERRDAKPRRSRRRRRGNDTAAATSSQPAPLPLRVVTAEPSATAPLAARTTDSVADGAPSRRSRRRRRRTGEDAKRPEANDRPAAAETPASPRPMPTELVYAHTTRRRRPPPST